jgi:hypothetical protein
MRDKTGQVKIHFAYHRHVGPRYEHGAVTIGFDGSQPYSFSSFVDWDGHEYLEEYVKKGVEQALTEKLGALEKTKVELVGVEIDEINSTPHGFQSAAYAATCAAFLT